MPTTRGAIWQGRIPQVRLIIYTLKNFWQKKQGFGMAI